MTDFNLIFTSWPQTTWHIRQKIKWMCTVVSMVGQKNM